jgi:hypothetical protein
LKEEEAKRITDTLGDWRGDLTSTVGEIGTLSELDESLTEM